MLTNRIVLIDFYWLWNELERTLPLDDVLQSGKQFRAEGVFPRQGSFVRWLQIVGVTMEGVTIRNYLGTLLTRGV